MKTRTGIALLVCIAVLFAAGAADSLCPGGEPQAAEDEIRLKIRLDLKEDIGLLVIDHELDGQKGSGGISNANKSRLRRDDVLDWTFCREHYGSPAGTVNLTLRFTVVTEYCDPNYDNVYPEEYLIPLEPLSFAAEFGGTYSIAVSGDRENGYRAALEETD